MSKFYEYFYILIKRQKNINSIAKKNDYSIYFFLLVSYDYL